jgi:hypothetical protein
MRTVLKYGTKTQTVGTVETAAAAAAAVRHAGELERTGTYSRPLNMGG